jgi:hypothetical protein
MFANSVIRLRSEHNINLRRAWYRVDRPGRNVLHT